MSGLRGWVVQRVREDGSALPEVYADELLADFGADESDVTDLLFKLLDEHPGHAVLVQARHDLEPPFCGGCNGTGEGAIPEVRCGSCGGSGQARIPRGR